MRYTFKAKNTTVTDALKENIIRKFNRIERLFPENTDVTVTLSVTKLENKVEASVNLHKRVLRAEVAKDDMYAAIDEVVDKLEKQMVKYKNRLRDKSRRDSSFEDELKSISLQVEEDEEDVTKIEKIKRFEIKPMDPEEAILEMELISHNFFVFRNAETDNINVVYKRKDGSFGLIDPEY